MLCNDSNGQTIASNVIHCDTFLRRLRGLMFRDSSSIKDSAYIFGYDQKSITQVTIHMFFVFMEIGVIWLDAQKCIVDMVVAKPFRPYYAPKQAAQYFIECTPDALELVNLGDKLSF